MQHIFPRFVWRIVCLLMAAMSSICGGYASVDAWVTAEHILIGEAGYQQACAIFRNRDIVRTAAQRTRAERFCFSDATLARHYGELTAYGGDYAAQPTDIPTDFEVMSARLEDLSDWSSQINHNLLFLFGKLLHKSHLTNKR